MDSVGRKMDLTTSDLSLLAYALHMAATAQSGAARRMFEAYAEVEQRRLRASRDEHNQELARGRLGKAGRALNTS